MDDDRVTRLLQELLRQLPRRADGRRVSVALLTGSVKGKQRRGILAELASGELSLVRARRLSLNCCRVPVQFFTNILRSYHCCMAVVTLSRARMEFEVETATPAQVVGTHALLSEPVHFANLGLAVVDEQHRFGVAQRAKLQNKNTPAPHVLAMTVCSSAGRNSRVKDSSSVHGPEAPPMGPDACPGSIVVRPLVTRT